MTPLRGPTAARPVPPAARGREIGAGRPPRGALGALARLRRAEQMLPARERALSLSVVVGT